MMSIFSSVATAPLETTDRAPLVVRRAKRPDPRRSIDGDFTRAPRATAPCSACALSMNADIVIERCGSCG